MLLIRVLRLGLVRKGLTLLASGPLIAGILVVADGRSGPLALSGAGSTRSLDLRRAARAAGARLIGQGAGVPGWLDVVRFQEALVALGTFDGEGVLAGLITV